MKYKGTLVGLAAMGTLCLVAGVLELLVKWGGLHFRTAILIICSLTVLAVVGSFVWTQNMKK